MPGRNKTGPRGEGAMTGRRMGDCAGEKGSNSFWGGFGRRRRFGFGGASGYGRNRAFRNETDQPAIEEEIHFLKDRLSWLDGLLHRKDRKEDI
ncbi:MAG: DUF5320 domain-containing protein [Bacteroidota bacterium]|nr:DUF5320 domain-containing protein [Bacteroidota bacterium]